MGLWITLVTLSTLVVVQKGIGITVKEMGSLQIYYDATGAAVPMLTDGSMVAPTLKTPLVRFGPLPCSCQQLRCGCCVNMRVNYFNFERQACTNFTYDPNKFAVEMNMLWNQQSVFNRSISGRNPPPVCIPAPIPYLPAIDQCVRLFNIHMPGYNMHVCMNLETRIERVPVLVMQFDCMQMGYNGVMLLKPEAEANQTITSPEAEEETTEVAQEAENVFDPVDPDKKKGNQTSSVNGTSSNSNSTNSEIETQGEGSDLVKPENIFDPVDDKKKVNQSSSVNSTSSNSNSANSEIETQGEGSDVEKPENIFDPVDDKKKVNQTPSVNSTSSNSNSTNSEIETQGEGSDVVLPENVYNHNFAESNKENSTSSQTSSFEEATTINVIEESLVSKNQSSDDILNTTEAFNHINNR